MGGLMPKAPSLPPPPPAPTADSAAVGDAARRERAARGGGRASTILTGTMGDTSVPSSAKAMLLGQ